MIFFVYVYDILGYVMFVVPAAPNGLAFPLRSVAFATWPSSRPAKGTRDKAQLKMNVMCGREAICI